MISWTEIMDECGNYRERFVTVFRRYEGQKTDERDAQGRTVKVTAQSFAEHVGIHPETFRDWLRKDRKTQAAIALPARNRRAESIHRDPQGTVADIMAAPDKVQDEIFHELKLRRAGVDTSTAGRKAAEATAHAQTEPIKRAMASTDVALGLAALSEAAEHLRNAREAGALTEESMGLYQVAIDAVQMELAEARFQLS